MILIKNNYVASFGNSAQLLLRRSIHRSVLYSAIGSHPIILSLTKDRIYPDTELVEVEGSHTCTACPASAGAGNATEHQVCRNIIFL